MIRSFDICRRGRGLLVCLFAFAAALSPNAAAGQTDASPTPAPRKSPAPRKAPAKPAGSAPIDFSGIWQLDLTASINPSYHLEGAILSVTQKGNHIWMQPIKQGKGSGVLAEEIVADGRAYEKALGPAGKGTVTARWSDDKTALWIEVQAVSSKNPNESASQRSVWKLSADRQVWVRESVSTSPGKTQSARLVFRRTSAPSVSPAPGSTPGAKSKS